MASRVNNILSILGFIGLVSALHIISINQYTYPMGDHDYYMPMLKNLIDPSFFPHDYLHDQLPQYPSVLWPLMAGIIQLTGAEIPTIFFILYTSSIFSTYAVTYLLAMSLFANRQVAFLSVFFLLFTQLHFADVSLLENGLVFRTLALPFILFGFYAFFEKRFVLAYVLTAIGLVIHPLSGIFSIAMMGLASLFLLKFINKRDLVLSIILFGVISSPIFIIKFTAAGPSMPLVATSEWLDIMRLRSSHHVFPFTWSRIDFFNAGCALLVLLISLKHGPKDFFQYRATQLFIVAILFMMGIGVIFTEIVPISFVIQLQFLRSMVMIFYFIPLLFANYYVKEIQQPTIITDDLQLILLSVFVFNVFSSSSFILVVLSFMSFVAITLIPRVYGTLPHIQISIPIYHWLIRHMFLLMLIGVIIVIGILNYIRLDPLTISNQDDPKWVDVQSWARQHTSVGAIFIIPPHLNGFRVDSERSVYVTWKDGTVAFFNESLGFEWLERLKLLGYEPTRSGGTLDYLEFGEVADVFGPIYRNLNEEKIDRIAQVAESCEVYFVTFSDVPELELPLSYKNNDYVIYAVLGKQVGCSED